MSYVNLKEMLLRAKVGRYAVGAFNVVDFSTTRAVINAAEQKKSPVIVQTSVKTIEYYDYSTIANWVKQLARSVSVPIALHLDHCKDIDVIGKCIEAGWSSVMIDASSFSFKDNIEMTCEMAKDRNVTVEGELGSIVGVEDDIFVNESEGHLADPEKCIEYIEATGIDLLAPAIGTAHGVYKKKPNIDFELLHTIAENTPIPLAIHGGTGLSEEVFKKCIENGGCKINISTNIKHIFRDAFEEFYRDYPNEYEPLKALKYMEVQTQKIVESFMDIFGSSHKA